MIGRVLASLRSLGPKDILLNTAGPAADNRFDSEPPTGAAQDAFQILACARKGVGMKVETTRFGTLEIEDSSVIAMIRGPLAFEDMTRYCLLQHRPDTRFRWLQSLDRPDLAFVVIDPSEFFSGYQIEISDADAEKLNLTSPEDALVLAIVTVGAGGREITANLAAPIVINATERTAMQAVLQDSRYSVRQPLAKRSGAKREREPAAGAA